MRLKDKLNNEYSEIKEKKKELKRYEKEFEEEDLIIESGILPKDSIMVVGGGSKIGKSVFVSNGGLDISIGNPFLGQFNVPTPQKVLYIQAEISQRSMQERLRKMINAKNLDKDILNENFFLINKIRF